jgi:nucleoid-associated protein YgaU
VRFRWGTEDCVGLLVDAKFGNEGENDITYELTLSVSEVNGGVVAQLAADAREQIPTDTSAIVAEFQRQIAQRRAEIEATRALRVTRAIIDGIANGIALVDNATQDVQEGVSRLANSTPGQLANNASRLIGLAQIAQISIRVSSGILSVVTAGEAVPSGDTRAMVAFWAMQSETLSTCQTGLATMRLVRASARAQTQRTVRFYEVRPGDTLESIARDTLGNAARANTLGLRPDQLTPGLIVRIPEAA